MKQLIISDYDSETDFTYVVIVNRKEINRGYNAKDLVKYGLYDEEWNMFDKRKLNFDKNLLIQDFDMIVYCDNGSISVYRNTEEDD